MPTLRSNDVSPFRPLLIVRYMGFSSHMNRLMVSAKAACRYDPAVTSYCLLAFLTTAPSTSIFTTPCPDPAGTTEFG